MILAPPLLALDASGPSCSVAVVAPDRAPVMRFAAMGRGQAERLVPMLADTLAAAKIDARALGGIACAVGPGSFTGIRIALAAAQGLALATGAPLVGVCSLAAVAEAQPDGDGRLVVAVDTGRGDLACLAPGLWDAPVLLSPVAAAFELVRWAGDTALRLAGTGARVLDTALKDHGKVAHVGPAGGPDLVEAIAVGRLALADRGLLPPRPVYLRPPEVTLLRDRDGGA